jgi:ribosomal protein L4
MVGRNGLFSGYKSQRTKGHRETAGKKNWGKTGGKEPREDEKKTGGGETKKKNSEE